MVLFFVLWISLWNVVHSKDLVRDLRLINIGLAMPRFKVGAYMNKRKQMEERTVMSSAEIMQIQTEIAERENMLAKKRKLLHGLEEKFRKLNAKVRHFVFKVVLCMLCAHSAQIYLFKFQAFLAFMGNYFSFVVVF